MEPSDARYPAVAQAAGHYESFYLKCGDAAARQALWLRYTVHKRPGAAPVGSLWATLFDAEADGPRGAKVSPGPEALGSGGADWLRVADARVGDDGCSGEIPGLASWELRFEDAERPFPYLPSDWMYSGKLPRTKALSLRPAVRASGTATVRDRTLALDRWPGMVGHNWGAEHAERWIWLHGTDFEQQRDAWLDVTIGRLRLGPWTTPWVANGCLSLDGVRHRLGGLGKVRGVRVAERPERLTLALPGDGLVVHGEVAAPREQVVGWVYADPAGPEHNTAHCAIADMTLTVARPGEPPRTLAVTGGATYELGMREHEHGIPLQPFGDP
ncbi:MAG TPA: hypothetical protein VFV85_01410 [Conexibacter sp.]|nr:hypothetical protein [Conexibacter sp.]